MPQRIEYEWVVETLEGEDDDIVDCSYWPEHDLAQALRLRAAILAEGKRADIGLCRHIVETFDGGEEELERSYAYPDDGTWPDRLECGARIPMRLLAMLAAHAAKEA